MKKTVFILFFNLMAIIIAFGQDSTLTRSMELKVLIKNQIGKDFSFNMANNKNEKNLLQLKYLGLLETDNHSMYKVLTWTRIWGSNFHTTGVILIFDENNKYIGKYILGGKNDLPYKIQKNNLVFSNKNKCNCDPSIITRVNFRKGIPSIIFLKCKGEKGDLYSFETDE
ncbi:MAG: hypothetical protein ACRDE2_12890 [Chitinophagaceae bacterium]